MGEILMMGASVFVEEREGSDELDAEARLRFLEWETRRRLTNQAMLNSIATRGEHLLTEEEVDELHELAEELGLDEDEAAQMAVGGLFASVVAQSYSSTLSGQCTQWLADVLTENRSGIPRTSIIGAAEKKGYTPSMVDRVSRNLNVKKRKGPGGAWFWYPPDEEALEELPITLPTRPPF
jgi:hypothetical protein